ncbi:hypothetical protein CA3LBN_002392 [Candidozyma haemuli]|uniref:Zn(2)-C6 fungal-type domain-containing protein n=1 Tax=Candidozyma haemuli TaxID=45357 RepID=A0ABX8I4U5_9ASCO|nr:hypothetical protein CA3LBN_002392 [[Candida] haemuloni]
MNSEDRLSHAEPPDHTSELSNTAGLPNGHLDENSAEYLDVNWDSNLILDANSEVLSAFDFHGGSNMVPLPGQIPVPNMDIHNQYVPPQKPEGTKANKSRSRPCDHCRRRKTKCVIAPGANNCVQCESKSITCTYNSPPRQDSDEPNKRKKLQEEQKSRVSTPDQYARNNGYGMNIVPPNVSIRDVQPVQDYSSMNNSLLKKTLSLQFPRSSFYIGPTSYLFDNSLLDVILSQKKPGEEEAANPRKANRVEQVNLSDTISLRRVGDKTQFILKDDQSSNSYQNMSNDVDAIEKFVAPHGQILIDLYFRIIHPSYPILHKKVFLEKYSRTHREFSAPLLAAVYALAIQWWDYDPQLNRFAKPNLDMMLKIALNNFMLEILKRPKLSAVQAGLLLLQCKHIFREANGASNNSQDSVANASASLNSSFSDSDYNDWVLCAQVVAMSEELGLALDCDKWKLPKWERGLRKRLAWAVFMEDKWLSLKNSRPSHISEDDWVVSELKEEDFPEKAGDGDLKEGSSDINNGKKNFMNLVRLSQILSGILKSLYSMKAMKDIVDINEVLQIAKPIQLKLRTWYHSLPIELQMTSVQPRKLCPNGYLQLSYFATELTLHRKIITTMHEMTVNNKPVPKELVDVCRTAAKTRLLASIEFVRDLKPEHIHSFWHSSSSANFTLIGTFAALLFVSAPTKEEADFYKDQIFNYRWILKISSKGFVQVGDALDQLDLVLKHIPGLLSDSQDQPGMVPQVPTIDYNKLYEQQMRNPTRGADNSQYSGSPASQATSVDGNVNGSIQNHRQPQQAGRFNVPNQQFQKGGREANFGNGMIRPSSAQQHRQSGPVVASPYDSPQAFNTPGFSANNSISRGSHINNSPQHSQGMSPKDAMTQQRSMLGNNSPGTGGGESDRRQSSTSHVSEVASHVEGASSKGDSPAVTRSPLTNRK